MQRAPQWFPVVQRGLLALAFGLLIFIRPDRSLAWFAPLMLFYAMADGVLAVAAAARAAYVREWWGWLLVEGLAGLSGIFVIALWPQANIPELTWSLTVWAAVTATAALVAAARAGKYATGDWLVASAAVVLLRFTVLGIGSLRAGEFAIAYWCVGGALTFTVLLLARVFRLRQSSDFATRGIQLFARRA